MSLSPLSAQDLSSRDPFQLDRLASELANRESSSSNRQDHNPPNHNVGSDDGLPALPEHVPLSHADPHLTAEVFNVEDFLLARSHTSLPDLRSELRYYLSGLKEELVKLINDDYEAFISLSTDLKDEGARLERLRLPLASVKLNIMQSKDDLQIIQNAIHEKLESRAKLREEQTLLHLLLKIFESVTRLESLLLITAPDVDNENTMEMSPSNFFSHPTRGGEATAEEKLRGNRAKHLGRVAAEYTQLLYHVQKATAEKCSFVDDIQWRIDRIQSTLSSDLDQLFSQTLTSMTDPKVENRSSELEKSKWITDITECLRTYDILGLWRDAEDVLRRDVVRVFMKKTVYPGALAAPPSPLVPHTPFHFGSSNSLTPALTPHTIPYTPFTAFVPKQNMYKLSDSSSDLPRAHLLDETDDSLARLYNQLLRFVERDICRIMDIAEKVTVVSPAESKIDRADDNQLDTQRRAETERRGFQIMAEVVWDELGRSIMDELGGVVFAAGRPKEFRKHYETTKEFIRSLELLAPSRQSVEAMRRHPVYASFERRWQLPVYFQLRWKEIIPILEDTLAVARLDSITPKNGAFATPQAAAVWIAASACWSSDIYIPELGHRFWRLTLQILTRYKTWLQDNVKFGDLEDKVADRTMTSSGQGGTPVPTVETATAESTAADDALLKQYSAALLDIKAMEANTLNLWQQVISMMMPTVSDDDMKTESALRECIDGFTSLVVPVSTAIIAILTKRCCENLMPVRSIPSQFRMANKRPPTEPSYFVTLILRPVKQFFSIGTGDGHGSLLREKYLSSYATEIFNNVTQRYINFLTAMKKTEESLRRLKKNTRPTFSLFGSASATDEGKDEERIRRQMILDVEAFGRDARSLEVDVDTNTHFAQLKEIVYGEAE